MDFEIHAIQLHQSKNLTSVINISYTEICSNFIQESFIHFDQYLLKCTCKKIYSDLNIYGTGTIMANEQFIIS